jgi:hypothetical protein
MKNNETVRTPKTGNRNGTRKNTPDIVNLRAQLAKIAADTKQKAQIELEKEIDKIYYTESGGIFGTQGIGFQKSNGKLIEFCVSNKYGIGETNLYVEEITLATALAWIEHFQFVAMRARECLQQEDEGYMRWLQTLRAAIQNA